MENEYLKVLLAIGTMCLSAMFVVITVGISIKIFKWFNKI